MRLIDADVLEAILENAISIQEEMSEALGIKDDEGVQMELKAYRDVLNGVKEQPTINPQEPVKPIHDENDYYLCGSCRGYVAFPNGDCKKSFCETCGRQVNWDEAD